MLPKKPLVDTESTNTFPVILLRTNQLRFFTIIQQYPPGYSIRVSNRDILTIEKATITRYFDGQALCLLLYTKVILL